MATGREAVDIDFKSSHVLAVAGAIVALQGGVHYRVSDQSGNFYFEQYARSMLAGAAEGAMVLTKGDNVVNTIRYLQRCEGERLDVRLVEQSMISYPWFKTMHGPHLPGVVLPGDVAYNSAERGLTVYSIRTFLEHNFAAGNSDIYVCGGWKELDDTNPQDTQAFKATTGFRTLPAGICERVVSDDGWVAALPVQVLSENSALPIDEFMTNKALKSLYSDALVARVAAVPPHLKGVNALHELDKYDARTWERNIHTHSQQALQRLAHWLVMFAQRNGDDTDVFELAHKILEKTFTLWPDSDLGLSAIGHRLLAIGCSRLMNKRARASNQSSTAKFQKKDCNSKLVIEHMRRYIELEDKLSVEVEKKIVEAYVQHPHALININLDDR